MSLAKTFAKLLEDQIGVPNAFNSEEIDKEEEFMEEQKNDYEAHRHDHEE